MATPITQGRFCTNNEFLTKYPGMRTNFLLYEGIISAVKYYQNKLNFVIPLDYRPIDNVTWKCIKQGNTHVQQVLTGNTH
jgi:hypothetical protein